MSSRADPELVKNVLRRLSDLSRIRDKIQGICNRYGISSRIDIYHGDSSGSSQPQQYFIHKSEHFRIMISNWVVKSTLGFPNVFDSDPYSRYRTHHLFFMHGPIISRLFLIPADSDSSIKYQGIIEVATRSMSESVDFCESWYMKILVILKPEFGRIIEANKSLEDYVSRVGSFKDSGKRRPISSILHLIMCHTLSKNIKAITLARQLSKGKIKVQDCLSILGMNKSVREKFIQKLKLLQLKDSLGNFITRYFSSLDNLRLDEYLDTFYSESEVGEEVWRVTPNDPFDFVRVMFLILSIVIKETASAEEEIKKTCGKRYSEVVNSILFYDDPINKQYSSSSPLYIFLPINHQETELDDILSYWEKKFRSVDAHLTSSGGRFRKKLTRDTTLDDIRTFFNYNQSFVISTLETYLSKGQNFTFNRPYKKIREGIIRSLSSLSYTDKQKSSMHKAATTSDFDNYLKYFSNLCLTLKRYLKSSFSN